MAYPVMTAERFWKKVNKNGPTIREDLGPCWLWPRLSTQGYGKTTIRLKHWLAHRLAWFYTFGELSDEICVCHECDVRNCVNPSHLWLGTNQENTTDKVVKGRQATRKKIVNAKFLKNQVCVSGERHGMSRLSNEQIGEIRSLRKSGLKLFELSQKFSVSQGHLSAICNGRAWSHILK